MFEDEIIPSQTSERDFCSAIFINNLHWRRSRESAKTLYGSYKNFNGDVPIINVDDILCETIKHVNKEHNGALYRATYEKSATVLKEVELDLQSSMTFPMKYYLMALSFFTSCGLRRKYNAKGVCAHMLWYLPPSSR